MKSKSIEKVGGYYKEDHCKRVAEYAYRLLTENLQTIGTVNDWSELAGCSRSWLGRCVKKHYGKAAKLILKEERYKKIVSVIKEYPHALAVVVAGLAAPWDEKRLCNFLTYHFHTNFTELRHEVLNRKPEIIQ